MWFLSRGKNGAYTRKTSLLNGDSAFIRLQKF